MALATATNASWAGPGVVAPGVGAGGPGHPTAGMGFPLGRQVVAVGRRRQRRVGSPRHAATPGGRWRDQLEPHDLAGRNCWTPSRRPAGRRSSGLDRRRGRPGPGAGSRASRSRGRWTSTRRQASWQRMVTVISPAATSTALATSSLVITAAASGSACARARWAKATKWRTTATLALGSDRDGQLLNGHPSSASTVALDQSACGVWRRSMTSNTTWVLAWRSAVGAMVMDSSSGRVPRRARVMVSWPLATVAVMGQPHVGQVDGALEARGVPFVEQVVVVGVHVALGGDGRADRTRPPGRVRASPRAAGPPPPPNWWWRRRSPEAVEPFPRSRSSPGGWAWSHQATYPCPGGRRTASR